MPIFIRAVAVATVLLSLALVAVSAYAAKSDLAISSPLARASAERQDESDSAVAGSVYEQDGAERQDESDSDGSANEQNGDDDSDRPSVDQDELVEAGPPTPTVVVRYAAPEGAAGVGVGVGGARGSGRSDLSVGGRVWPVLSLKPGVITVSARAEGGLDIPIDQLAVMLQVSKETGLPWQLFGAIAKVESDLGRNMATSWAGAIGYGQFMPLMWEAFGEGGDPYDFRDVIPAMGRFLLEAGAETDVRVALYAYNHSWPYVAQVLSFAAAYGYPNSVFDLEEGATNDIIWPVVGPISSYFNPAHPLGIDIDLTMSPGTPVLAAHDGVVLFAGGDPCCSYGYYVILVAPSGMTTLYAHFQVLAVGNGQTVRQGEPLGAVGCTGYCTGTHLHFELIAGGVRHNPLDYLP